MAVSDPCPNCNGTGEVISDFSNDYYDCQECLGCGVIIGKDHDGLEPVDVFDFDDDHDTIWFWAVSKTLRDHPEWFKFPTSIPPARKLNRGDDDDERKPYGRI